MAKIVRLAVGIGDPEKEREVLPELDVAPELVVAERCLSAETLLEAVLSRRVDAVLVAYDLHRLGRVLPELEATGVPRVLLAHNPDEPRWQALGGIVLPDTAPPALIRDALQAAIKGEAFGRVEASVVQADGFDVLRLLPEDQAEPARPERRAPAADHAGSALVLAVASGHGAPGRTFVAVNLAAALGAVAPTLLIDADVAGPSVAVYLDADPTRNIFMVAHAEPESPWEWQNALEQEAQPLDRRSPQARVLAGIPKPDMRQRLNRRFLEGLLPTLRREARYVVIDAGAELLGADGAFHRAVLGLADQVLLVTAADLVGLWHARTAFGVIRDHLLIDPSRVALVLNGHDPHFHHSRTEIEWSLGAGTAAVVPYEHAAVQRSISAQRPVVLDPGSRAGRALVELASRVHGGKLVLPPEPDAPPRRGIAGMAERLGSSLRMPVLAGARRAAVEASNRELDPDPSGS